MMVGSTTFLVERCEFLRYKLSIFSKHSIRYETVTDSLLNFKIVSRVLSPWSSYSMLEVPLALERLRSLKCCN